MKPGSSVLVTGAAGFLGSHLCDRLLDLGHQVAAVDNLITGSLDNIAHLNNRPDFQFIEHDICRPINITGPLDWIFDLASPASPIDYLKLPVETLMVGSYGVHNLLELAKAKGAGFLLTSTSEVYGDPLVHPQDESYWGNVNPVGPRSVYDESKRFAEAMTMAYRRYFGVETRIVRIFNTYGPRMRLDDGRVVPTLIWQALHCQPLTVFGDGSQTRSFCYVSDLIDGILKMPDRGGSDPVNLGNPNEMSILDFARHIKRLTGAEAPIEFRPLPQDDPKQRKPVIDRAKRILGWEPQVDFERGIAETIEWFKVKQKRGE
jgi:dTDP-glucose 4,6-dehydratase